ncbi:MAG TPA: 30S ribosomal protein S24e [Candidatus Thermoplasmatota archaeon]|jgi:small subunit ribosomal protein S24e|nr:30S ribosomal protein S24e [Candidatus Thermoplasmatota archaeon]
MDVEIVSKYDNKLLGRTEVRFRASHSKEKTPQRDQVREALAKALGSDKGAIVVDEMHSEFGKPETIGYAKVYGSVEAAKKLEPHHIQLRNKFPGVEKKTKAEKAKAAAPKKRGA